MVCIVLKQQETIYIDLGCSSKKYKPMATGSNYLIREYILLVVLQHAPINTLWGQASGEASGSLEGLWNMHNKRDCHRYNKSDFYVCGVVAFLNEFFRRLDINDLMRYTVRLENSNLEQAFLKE
jgi:hypothetical protein